MYRTPLIPETDKAAFYEALNHELKELIEFEDEWLPALANAAALLGHQLRQINWAGFYLVKHELLILGPFIGKPACSAIVLGQGVCGAAAAQAETVVVPDVHQYPGHIACDEASSSEIVIPIIQDGRVTAVLDIDSPVMDRFKDVDVKGLEIFANLLATCIDWDKVSF